MLFENAPSYVRAGKGWQAVYSLVFTNDLQYYIPLRGTLNGMPAIAKTVLIENLDASQTLTMNLGGAKFHIPPFTDAYFSIANSHNLIIESEIAATVPVTVFTYDIPPGMVQRGAGPEVITNDPLWSSVNRLYHFSGQNNSVRPLNSKTNIFDDYTNSGVSISTAQGKFGQSLLFDASGDSASLNPSGIGTVGANQTIEFFIYFSSLINDRSIIQIGTPFSSGFTLATYNGGVDLAFYNQSNILTAPQFGCGFQINTWYHIALSIISSEYNLYLNGVYLGKVNMGTINALTSFTIGADTVRSGFLGYVDELRQTSAVRYLENFTPTDKEFPSQ